MKEDNSELIEYLDEKFSNVDKKFSQTDEKISNISKKVLDLDEKLERIEKNKADKSDVNELTKSVDAYADKADTYFQEILMLSKKVDRHEKWIKEIAEKVGVKLKS